MTLSPEKQKLIEEQSYYCASKTAHAYMWRQLRSTGVKITSTWIDEAGEGETASYSELAQRCFDDIRRADALLLYCQPGEILKGALIEVGAALSLGKPILAVGNCDSISRVFAVHPNWYNFEYVEHAVLHPLTELAQSLTGEGWQPIETAPKDGTKIICLWLTPNGPVMDVMQRHSGEWIDPSTHEEACVVPDYWQPLPTPPKL